MKYSPQIASREDPISYCAGVSGLPPFPETVDGLSLDVLVQILPLFGAVVLPCFRADALHIRAGQVEALHVDVR